MKYVIIGNSAAGISAAKEIRARDKTSDITIITEEAHPLYSRIRLPELFSGKISFEKLYLNQTDWYDSNLFNLRLKVKVIAIKPDEKKILLDNGELCQYDSLLIATGSQPKVLKIPGATGKKIFTLRTIEDSMAIKEIARKYKNAVVIGGGLLGLEVAMALARINVDATVIEYNNRLLPDLFDEECSTLIFEKLKNMNLKFIMGLGVNEIKDINNKKEITLDNGQALEADFIQLSIGVIPNTLLAKEASIAVNNGIITNEYFETNVGGIFAAGDVAEVSGTTSGLWRIATEQGALAGRNMLGEKIKYSSSTPITTLKVADLTVSSIGRVKFADNERIDIKKIGSHKIFHSGGKIMGGIVLGDLNLSQKLRNNVGKDLNNLF